jgi:hypothetical protein
VPTPEAQWQDQVVIIRRPAAATPTDDGYVEATSKDLATGKEDRFASDNTAATPAAGDKSGGGQ